MEDDLVLSFNRLESWSTNPPGHLWRDKWTALSGPLSIATSVEGPGRSARDTPVLGGAAAAKRLALPRVTRNEALKILCKRYRNCASFRVGIYLTDCIYQFVVESRIPHKTVDSMF
jgi:hypothetical protein